MPTIGWTFSLEDGQHTVELDHAWILGTRTLRFDDQVVVRSVTIRHALLDRGSIHTFSVGKHTCAVKIWSNGAGLFRYELTINGRVLAPSTPLPSQALVMVYTGTIAVLVGLLLTSLLHAVRVYWGS